MSWGRPEGARPSPTRGTRPRCGLNPPTGLTGPPGEARAGITLGGRRRDAGAAERRGCSPGAEQNGGWQSQQLGQRARERGRPSSPRQQPQYNRKRCFDGRTVISNKRERRGRNASVKGAESAGEAREDCDFVPLVSFPSTTLGSFSQLSVCLIRRHYLNLLLLLEGTAALMGGKVRTQQKKTHARSSSCSFCWEASYLACDSNPWPTSTHSPGNMPLIPLCPPPSQHRWLWWWRGQVQPSWLRRQSSWAGRL